MAYSFKDHWATLAKKYDTADSLGFAPVLHPGTPGWFNQIIDDLQFQALRRALAIATISPGARLLDVGCGTGRWIRRYRELGFSPVGVDATFEMLRIARVRDTRDPLILGLADCLPFADSQFDGVSDITVVQHIPYELQTKALREMVRVLRPGGRLILLELVRGSGPHIFPRPPWDWISAVESCGATLIDYFGQEFRFMDRFFVRLALAASGRIKKDRDGVPLNVPASPPGIARDIYWRLRRVTTSFSTLTEPIFVKLSPASFATHAVFVFEKRVC
jgi:ubiquinone/menaquinone biosynthesis C-methylase UbiE